MDKFDLKEGSVMKLDEIKSFFEAFGTQEEQKKSLCNFFGFDESISNSELLKKGKVKLKELEDLIKKVITDAKKDENNK